jgi:ribose/xylose/arabinose/galactoside ABC-type transport system permease subunit
MKPRRRIPSYLQTAVLELILLLLCILLALAAPGFLTAENLLNVLRNVSMQGVIAFGMTMVIIAGEIDLSVGSAVAFSGCLTAYLTQLLTGPAAGWSPSAAVPAAMGVALTVGFLLGSFTGFMRTRYQVPSFITTLALLTGLTGAAELITNGFPINSFPDWYNFFGGGYVAGVPFPAIIFLLVFVLVHILMNLTAFGRSVYAVGGNAEAARLSGINVAFVKVSVLGFTSMLAALSGILQSAEIMAGTATTAKGWELDVIAAVIIGGTSLMGGSGRIWGTMVGIVFLGIIINGMTLLNISEYWQHVVRGVLILAAVLLNRMQTGKETN